MVVSTYATLVNSRIVVPSSTTAYLAVDRHFLTVCLGDQLSAIELEEPWYLDRYPDVAEAIARGEVTDGRDHYVRYGYWENRMPYPIQVDEAWYVKSYPDVAQAVAEKTFASAQEHFDRAGFQEGRFPHPHFELRTRGPVFGGSPAAEARPLVQVRLA